MPNIQETLQITFTNLINQFSNFFGNFIGAAVILLIGWIVAKIVKAVLFNILSKTGIDKLGNKLTEIDAIKKFNVKIEISKIISQVVYIFILLFILISSADILGVPAISNMFLLLVNFIPKFIAASIMMVLGLFLSDVVKKFVVGICDSFNIPSSKLIGMGVFVFLMLITIIAALGQADINTSLLESSFNILIGGVVLAFSIGYGIATKDILLNMLSSFYTKNKYNPGQVVEIDGVKGEIVEINNLNIILKNGDVITSFPLKVLQNQKITIYKS